MSYPEKNEGDRRYVYWVCGGKARERRRVGKRGTERERGWANKGNKERMRLMAERSWHSAIHSVVASRQTCVRSQAYVVRCSQGARQLLSSFC